VNGIQGRGSDSDAEMLANGFDVRVDLMPNEKTQAKSLHQVTRKQEANPSWFGSWPDAVIAFMLPLLTALSGIRLLRCLFGSGLTGRMAPAEQLACGLGLGMMAVAALTLGVKLCGFHGRGWVLALVATGALAELWLEDWEIWGYKIAGGFRKMVSNPVTVIFHVVAGVVFLILFRLAALQGAVEYDAVAAWLLKAKIFFLCTGNEIVQWFSNPRLAYAHLDYPTLVPALHAATYDSIGHVDEFVTKFWPVWMLLFLLAALASLNRSGKTWFHAPHFFLLGVLLLPFTQTYVQMEGATLPMIFFTVMGFVQCALGLIDNDRVRLGLGMTLLFGAAMAKFEGAIFLALTAGWMLLPPSLRPPLKPTPRLWRMLAFCFLSALPFVCLRMQIPVLNYESGWAGYAMAHPGITCSCIPKIFFVILARLFLNPDFANWSAADGQIHWIGRWEGLPSLYNHLTLGLPWVCLLLTIMLWFATPNRRPIIIWTLGVFISSMIAFSLVFASFVSISDLNAVLNEIGDLSTGRYLFPLLLAWATVMLIIYILDQNHPVDKTHTSNSG
jgi:hypothetical protein